MKKVLGLVLAIVMVISLAIPAAALASPTAKAEDLLPGLTEESSVIVILHSLDDVREKLSKEILDLMVEAKAKLKETCPEGFAVKYFCYVEIIDSEGPVSVVFDPIDHNEIVFKQYVDGAWVELEFTINEDATITVDGIVEAPLAIFTK